MHRKTTVLVALTALVALAGLASPALAQSALKVGVFDPQRVSEETIEGKRIQAKLEELRDARQREIQDQERSISEAQQQLNQQALSLSPEKRQQMEIDIQRRLLELNSRKDIATRSFQLEVAAEEAQFNEKLRTVVLQFARAEEFSIVLEVAAVAYAAPSVDVTTAVIDAFNRMYPATGQ